MTDPRRRIPIAIAITTGLTLGWAVASYRLPVAGAKGGERLGDYSLATGPVLLQYNERTKTQADQDAIYFLDYRGGRLLATVPVQRQTPGESRLLDGFIERDLVADFKVDLERGAAPRFLMTTGSLGAYGEGYAPLFVFETTTGQVAVYKVKTQTIGTKSSSKFELLEIRSFTKDRPPTDRATGGDYSLTTGPIALQHNEQTKTQAAQDAIYFLDNREARLLATAPIQRQMPGMSRLIDDFMERDLAADFKVDLDQGPSPHFLMTTASLGAYGEGYAPLFVFETTTRQVAAYKVKLQTIGVKSSSKLDLIEVKTYAALPPLPAAP